MIWFEIHYEFFIAPSSLFYHSLLKEFIHPPIIIKKIYLIIEDRCWVHRDSLYYCSTFIFVRNFPLQKLKQTKKELSGCGCVQSFSILPCAFLGRFLFLWQIDNNLSMSHWGQVYSSLTIHHWFYIQTYPSLYEFNLLKTTVCKVLGQTIDDNKYISQKLYYLITKYIECIKKFYS